MTDRRQQLLAGGRVLAKSLGQQNTRDEFARNGMSMDAQVVLTIESEPLRDVMARTRRHEPPVVLAVYYPDSGRLDFLTVEPGREPDVEPGDSGQVGDGATIGMLAEYLRQRSRRGNRGWTFKMGASNRELDRIADSVHVFASVEAAEAEARTAVLAQIPKRVEQQIDARSAEVKAALRVVAAVGPPQETEPYDTRRERTSALRRLRDALNRANI